MIHIELLELYYKKYTDTVKASDYIEWANESLYMDVLEMKKLASMGMKEPLNLFEIEEMFEDVMKALQREIPSKDQCLDHHIKKLHSQLLMPVENAILIVQEMYDCAVEHALFDEQMNWQEVSDAIDDFQYGDNRDGYSVDKINEMIMANARRLWHTEMSKITFNELLGQKVIAIDQETHFIIQLEKGALIIECPWRIRDTGSILLGETDIQSNQKEWKSVEELLVGTIIEDIQLVEHCPLLIVQFDKLFLDVFHASSYFDGWTVTDEEDFYLFSMHGGNIG